MALGIEPNSIAPQLIQNSGAALVQGIRQIGQQISGHLTEMQVKRDLGALAQEMQGLNVQSNEFPIQLAQLTGRHPLAARDDRAKMMLVPLGAAHAQWQAGEAEARAFNRAMAMQGIRTRDARETAAINREAELEMPQNIGGALVVPKDPLTGQPNVLVPAPARAGAGPKTLAPGAILVDPTGKKLAENPKTMTASPTESRMKKKSKIDLLMRRDKDLQAEIANSIRRRDALSKQRMEITKADDPNAVYLDNTVRAIEQETAALRQRRTELQNAIESIEAGSDEVEAIPEVLPAAGAVVTPAAGANVQRVPVLDPNGNPMQLRADQVEAALAAGWKRR